MLDNAHLLKIKSKKLDANETMIVEFDVPDNLKKAYAYRCGQLIVLAEKGETIGDSRNYSICASQLENSIRIGVKKIPGGYFSSLIHDDLNIGDELQVQIPEGRFGLATSMDDEKHYVCFAAGSGVTPVYSIVKSVLEENPQAKVTFVYGNKSPEHVILATEIEALCHQYSERLNYLPVYSQSGGDTPLHQGRITANKVKELIKTSIPAEGIDDIFICGPFGMVKDVRQIFMRGLKFDRRKIHVELFYTGVDE